MNIRFEKRLFTDLKTSKRRNVVAVIRDGQQVALLPDWDRLRRAMNLSLEEIQLTINHFYKVIKRPPTQNELVSGRPYSSTNVTKIRFYKKNIMD
jgi:hypothetical protein